MWKFLPSVVLIDWSVVANRVGENPRLCEFLALFSATLRLSPDKLNSFPFLPRQNLELRENSLNYNNWIKTPLPMYLKIHLFNWTNPEAFNNVSVKPDFVQMGPYVFLEKHERVNLTWHPENDTVSFYQRRTWHFVPEMSNGTLDDEATQVNTMSAVNGEFAVNLSESSKS